MTVVIGLTGNIGTGKSTVLRMLGELGSQVIDADKLAHEVMAPDGPAYGAVIDAFGPQVVGPDGSIDRSVLGEIVFGSAEELRRLESLVHPAVIGRTRELIDRTDAEVVVVEAIKLLESGLARQLCNEVWVVSCLPEQQLERLMAQRRMSAAEARLRLDAQSEQTEKLAQADVVIDNSGTRSDTRRQVEEAWRALQDRMASESIGDAEETARQLAAGLIVRPASLEDAAGVLSVLNTIVREQRFTALDRELTLEEEIEFLSRRGPRDALFVAEHDGHVVAFQVLDPFMPAIASMAHVAQMGTYVLPSYRGQSVGRRLFGVSCDFARREGYRKVVIYVRAGNRQAQDFYQRLGFQCCGRLRNQTRIGGDYEDEILYEYFLEEQ